MVEPVGIEPTLPPCKGGVLPLNYGPRSRWSGWMTAGGPPGKVQNDPAGKSWSERRGSNPRPPAPKAGALPLRYAPSWPPARCRRPRPRWQPFCLASAQTIAAPVPATTSGYFQNGKHHVLWSLPVRGGSFSLHPRRPSLRGGVKSEIILIFVSRRPSTRFRRVCSGLRQRLGSYLAPLPVRPSSRLFSKSRGSRWAFPISLKTECMNFILSSSIKLHEFHFLFPTKKAALCGPGKTDLILDLMAFASTQP